MKKFEIYSVAIILSLTTVSAHAMFKLWMHSPRKQPINMLHNNKRFFGITVATMPQTAKGVLGDFRLDKKHDVRKLLAAYIAADKKINLECAVVWANWQDTQKAYDSFLGHNSAINIKNALNDGVIDTQYAIRSLYFTQKIAWAFEDFLHNWCDRLWSKERERNQLLHDLAIEQESVAALVDFLSQKPSYYELPVSQERMFVSHMWQEFSSHAKNKKEIIHQIKTAENPQTHESDILGSFTNPNFNFNFKITDYLGNYLARDLKIEKKYVDRQAKIKDIKKAFQTFLQHNHPVFIYEMLKQQQIKKVHAQQARDFTRDVIWALEIYLNKDHLLEDETDVFTLYWAIKRLTSGNTYIKWKEIDSYNS